MLKLISATTLSLILSLGYVHATTSFSDNVENTTEVSEKKKKKSCCKKKKSCCKKDAEKEGCSKEKATEEEAK